MPQQAVGCHPLNVLCQCGFLQDAPCRSCRDGYFCPSPAEQRDCPPGRFCPKGSVETTSCEFEQLVEHSPGTVVPSAALTVHQRIFDVGDPMGGNVCPPKSSTPTKPCPPVSLSLSLTCHAQEHLHPLCQHQRVVASTARRGPHSPCEALVSPNLQRLL